MGAERIVLVKPQTFMNRSGEAVSSFVASISRIWLIFVIYDLDLAPACALERTGSAGGHQGMENIIQHLDSKEFPRLRLIATPDATASIMY